MALVNSAHIPHLFLLSMLPKRRGKKAQDFLPQMEHGNFGYPLVVSSLLKLSEFNESVN